MGVTDDHDRHHKRGSDDGTQHTNKHMERSSKRSGGHANTSHEPIGESGRAPPLPIRGTEAGTTVKPRLPKGDDQVVAWDVDSSEMSIISLPYVGKKGCTIEWDDHMNRLQITRSKPATVGTAARPMGIAIADRSTPTSEPVKDISRATRWLQETDQSINMALRRLAEPTPEIGETASELRSRQDAYLQVQATSNDIEDAKREHRERRARLTRATESLVKDEEEVAQRMHGLTEEQSRTVDLD